MKKANWFALLLAIFCLTGCAAPQAETQPTQTALWEAGSVTELSQTVTAEGRTLILKGPWSCRNQKRCITSSWHWMRKPWSDLCRIIFIPPARMQKREYRKTEECTGGSKKETGFSCLSPRTSQETVAIWMSPGI